ncbi:MAG: peptidylprolyl isomerase [bacterium]|nr:peptidylprolyl isomerase [bacterium]
MANAPRTMATGIDAVLAASNPPAGQTASYVWSVVEGDGEFSDPNVQNGRLTVAGEGEVTVQVEMTINETGETFPDTQTIEIVPEGTFFTYVQGPTEATAHEEIELTAALPNAPTGAAISIRWRVLAGGTGDFSNTTSATGKFTPRNPGTLTIEMEAVDTNTGISASDEYRLIVFPNPIVRLTVERNNLVLVGEPTTLEVSLTDFEDESIAYRWSVVSGNVVLQAAPTATPTITVNSLQTAVVEVTATGTVDGLEREGNATVYLTAVTDFNPGVVIDVDGFGEIPITLEGELAPGTVANFLNYVDNEHFDGNTFHRVLSDPPVIQAGDYQFVDGEYVRFHATRDPISNESDNGLSNLRGTVSMALLTDLANPADTGDHSFFINLVDNADLDNNLHTVFGNVTGAGMEIVEAIGAVPTSGDDFPLEPVIINTIRRTAGSSGP